MFIDLAIISLDVCMVAVDIESMFTQAGVSVRSIRIIRLVRLLRLLRAYRIFAIAITVQNKIFSEYVGLVLKLGQIVSVSLSLGWLRYTHQYQEVQMLSSFIRLTTKYLLSQTLSFSCINNTACFEPLSLLLETTID